MFGKLFSAGIKVVTLPVDVVNIGLDVASGGSGSKHSRSDSPLGSLERVRDEVADSVEEALD